jgi:uncharacterized protein involved in exopolysaccharide biosynthesis
MKKLVKVLIIIYLAVLVAGIAGKVIEVTNPRYRAAKEVAIEIYRETGSSDQAIKAWYDFLH